MHKITSIMASVCVALPAYANDVWQFKVTKDQSGPDSGCNELPTIPCSITSQTPPYILGTLTTSAALNGYATGPDLPITTAFDDNHLISFVTAPGVGLGPLNWPTDAPLLVNISVNEVNGELSGSIYLDLDGSHSSSIVMMGEGNTWVGYWRTFLGVIHQIRVTSPKGH